MNAKQILLLIEARHTNDVFVPECKDGSTVFGSHFRLDAWALKRSWASPLTIGYEIKVSRSDFLKDEKIPAYRDMCNCLYLVAPANVISPEEVPEYCGLLVPASTGSRLFTKRKAPYREIEEPSHLYKYILMSRATLRGLQEYHVAGNKQRYWRQWMRNREIDRDFGYRVGVAIREEIQKCITEVRKKNEELEHQIADLQGVWDLLVEAGFDPSDRYALKYRVEQKLMEIESGISDELRRAVRAATRVGKELADVAERLEAQLGNREGT